MRKIVSALLATLLFVAASYGQGPMIPVGVGAGAQFAVATTLESLGVSTANTGAQNATIIQAAMDSIGGNLTLTKCGTYLWGAEVQIGDNTSLTLAPCVIPQRSVANINMISTKAYHATPTSVTLSAANTSVVTFTSASPTVMTWTGLPLVEGQAIILSNSGGALPTGLLAATPYFIRNVSGNTANLALGPSGSGAALINTSSAGTGTQTATQTLTSIKVTWTAHGRSVGDPISLEGANQSYYNGIFIVDSVPDANTLTVRIIRTPLVAPTGTTVARVANQHIKVLGGTWDYNSPTLAKSPLLDAVGLFGFVYDLEVGNIHAKNGGTYVLDTGAQRQVWIHDITVDSTQDIIKAYGPSFNVTIERVDGRSTDDGVSFQTQENPSAFPLYIWTKGDLIDCTAKRIGSQDGINVGDVVVLYIGGAGYADQIHFEDIAGGSNAAPTSTAHLVLLTGYAAADPAGTVTIKKVRGWSVVNPIEIDYGTYQHVRIEDVAFGGQPVPYSSLIANGANYSSVYVSSVATVYDLIVDGWSLPNGLLAASSAEYDVVLVDQGIVANLTVKNISIYTGAQMAAVRINGGSTVGVLSAYDVSSSASIESFQIRSGVTGGALGFGAPQINIYGGFVQSAGLIYTGSAVNLSIVGVNVISATQGIVTSDQNVTIDIYESGNKVGTNAWTHAYANSPLFNFHELNFLTLSADQTGTDTINAQTWFPGGGATQINVPANSTYFFEGSLTVTKSAGTVSHTIGNLWGGTAVLTSMEYQYIALAQDAATFSAAAPVMLWGNVATVLTTWPTASTSAAQVYTLYVRGIVRVTSAGTFAPQFKYSAATGGAPTVKGNTFFRMTPIGSGTVLNFGPWN